MRLNLPTWTVDLDAQHPEFQHVELHRETGYDHCDVLIVDADRFIQLTELHRPSFVIPRIEHWKPEKRAGIAHFLKPPGSVPMPYVSLQERQEVVFEHYWWIFKKKRLTSIKAVSYTNGRHRARYLHAAGARWFPVMCPKDDIEEMRLLCGWDS